MRLDKAHLSGGVVEGRCSLLQLLLLLVVLVLKLLIMVMLVGIRLTLRLTMEAIALAPRCSHIDRLVLSMFHHWCGGWRVKNGTQGDMLPKLRRRFRTSRR